MLTIINTSDRFGSERSFRKCRSFLTQDLHGLGCLMKIAPRVNASTITISTTYPLHMTNQRLKVKFSMDLGTSKVKS